jgi:hypothetical protein
VDRIGRNQRDVLNTAYMIHETRRLLVTHGHDGPWNLDDPNDEMRLSAAAGLHGTATAVHPEIMTRPRSKPV